MNTKAPMKFLIGQVVTVNKPSSEYHKASGKVDSIKNKNGIRYVVDVGDDILIGFDESELKG